MTRPSRPLIDFTHGLDGVDEQIEDHLLQLDPISQNGRQKPCPVHLPGKSCSDPRGLVTAWVSIGGNPWNTKSFSISMSIFLVLNVRRKVRGTLYRN